MASILRGDIYWADLDPAVGHEQAGRRPVLILSRPAFNDRSGTVVAVALTSVEPRAGFPLTWELTRSSLNQARTAFDKLPLSLILLRLTPAGALIHLNHYPAQGPTHARNRR